MCPLGAQDGRITCGRQRASCDGRRARDLLQTDWGPGFCVATTWNVDRHQWWLPPRRADVWFHLAECWSVHRRLDLAVRAPGSGRAGLDLGKKLGPVPFPRCSWLSVREPMALGWDNSAFGYIVGLVSVEIEF